MVSLHRTMAQTHWRTLRTSLWTVEVLCVKLLNYTSVRHVLTVRHSGIVNISNVTIIFTVKLNVPVCCERSGCTKL